MKKESDFNGSRQGKRRTPAAPTAPRRQTKIMAVPANALANQLSMSPDVMPQKQYVEQGRQTSEEGKRDTHWDQQQDALEINEEQLQERP